MKEVKFRSNLYVRASPHQVNVEMTNIVNTFVDSDHEDLLKKAEEALYPLGWSLKEYQDLAKSRQKRRKRRHND
jgi:hypothetical protein